MTFPSLNRHQIREKALQAIFQIRSNQELEHEEAITMALLSDMEEDSDSVTVPEYPYLAELVNGVLENEAAINERIQPFLKNWTMNRLAKADVIILQIATYEIAFSNNADVPPTVALNEAIELAKAYCDDSSRKFINAVLSNLLKEIQNP